MEEKLKNTQFRFSFYKNIYSAKEPDGQLDINELIEIIKYGYLKKEITQLRNSNDEEYKKYKTKLPAVTTSGIFSKRNSKGLIKHSGLIQIDIDNVADYESLFKAICKSTYTYICFRSPGGKGIKVIIKINPSVKTHLDQFYALEKYFKKGYNVDVDTVCKDVSRCMLLSYDPELYCNPFSDVFEELYTPSEKLMPHLKSKKTTIVKQSKNDNEYIESLIAKLNSNKIDLTSTPGNWLKVGFALCSAFGENGRGYYHRISEQNPNYNFKETDKKYTSLLKQNKGQTKLASLVFLANKMV